jgi:hypothetical protein
MSRTPSIEFRMMGRWMKPSAWGEWARIALWITPFAVADRWLGIPIFVSVPSAFLGVLIYGYFAFERVTKPESALIDDETAAWDAMVAAARDLREAESEHASAALLAERENAYAAAMERCAIAAKRVAEYRARHTAGASGRAWRTWRR